MLLWTEGVVASHVLDISGVSGTDESDANSLVQLGSLKLSSRSHINAARNWDWSFLSRSRVEDRINHSGRSQCLKFLHIPKTGGTSIDSANMHQDGPAFDSLMRQTYMRIASNMSADKYESEYGSSLGRMYDDSHKSLIYYTQTWMPSHRQFYHMLLQPDDGQLCEDIHTPPSNAKSVQKFFTEDDCKVFCAVREPLQRFISSYEMTAAGPCDPEGFESTLGTFLPHLQEKPNDRGCLFTPQVMLVYGVNNKSQATTQYCGNILRTEHLNDDFDAFMQANGQALKLADKELMGESTYSFGCKVNRDNVTQAAKDLVFEHFRADYEAFGYPRP